MLIGHLDNQENVTAIIESIIDIDKDSYSWQGSKQGISLTINNRHAFINNDDDLAAEVYRLWKEDPSSDPNTEN